MHAVHVCQLLLVLLLEPSLRSEARGVFAEDVLVQTVRPDGVEDVGAAWDKDGSAIDDDGVPAVGDALGRRVGHRGMDAHAFLDDGLQVRQLAGVRVGDDCIIISRAHAGSERVDLALQFRVDARVRHQVQQDDGNGRSGGVGPGHHLQRRLGKDLVLGEAVPEEGADHVGPLVVGGVALQALPDDGARVGQQPPEARGVFDRHADVAGDQGQVQDAVQAGRQHQVEEPQALLGRAGDVVDVSVSLEVSEGSAPADVADDVEGQVLDLLGEVHGFRQSVLG